MTRLSTSTLHTAVGLDRPVGADKAITAERTARIREEAEKQRKAAWDRFIARRGVRYTECRLANFEVNCELQREHLAALRRYAEELRQRVTQGDGLILFGPSGTGKDHLLVAMCRVAIKTHNIAVVWRGGASLHREFRECIEANDSGGGLIRDLAEAAVLYLSDPVPPGQALTAYQSSTLFEVIDRRYSNCKPTWISVNVASGKEADERLGAAIVDRLRHGALTFHCDWPSYRKAQPAP
ncbi:MAG: ATP-binding protein [Pirellulales bacterium]|nr:ATP-binding protein [Pirellulales bacterium]